MGPRRSPVVCDTVGPAIRRSTSFPVARRLSPGTILLWSIGLAAFAARLHGLGDKPFWLDEVATFHRATASLRELVASSLHADHYPSYFLLTWLAAKFGASQWLLRLPSAIFGALAASATYAVGQRVGGRASGAIAGLLMALSPFEVQFGQEARSYTLVTCLILIALWGLVKLAQDRDGTALPFWRKSPQRAAWLAYGLGTAAALDVLNAAIPWLVCANLCAIVIAPAATDKKRSFWRNWLWVQLGIVAAWLPMLILVFLARSGDVIDDVGWAWPASEQTLWSIVGPVYLLRISNFVTAGTAPAAVPVLSLAVVAFAAAGMWRLRHCRPVAVVLGAATVALPLTLGLVSLLVPVLVPRYFVWSAAPFFILAGVGLGQLPRARTAIAMLMVSAACLINLKPYYSYETKPRWDLVAKLLAANAQPGDVVLVNSYYAYWVLTAFAAQAGLDESQIMLTWEAPKAISPPPGHTVWAVYGRTGPAVAETAAQFQASIAALGPPPEGQTIGRFITLWRYSGTALSERRQDGKG